MSATASRFWMTEFNSSFNAWLQSGRSRDDLLDHGLQSLKNMLERGPQHAEVVQMTALATAFNARIGASPRVVADFARLGIDADLLLVDLTEGRSARRVLLNLFLAEAELERSNAFVGLAALDLAEDLTRQHTPAPPLGAFFTGYCAYLRAALHALSLDVERAASAHARASEQLETIVSSPKRLLECGISLLVLILGAASADVPESQRKALTLLAVSQIRRVVSLNAVGRVRVLRAARDSEALKAAATSALSVLRAAGVPSELTAIDLAPVVASLPDAMAADTIDLLIARAGNKHGAADGWRAALSAARLTQEPAGQRTWTAIVERSLKKTPDPLLTAFARGQLLEAETDAQIRPRRVREFLEALGGLAAEPGNPLQQLQVRALFDGPVAAAIEWASDEFIAFPSAETRTRLAVFLDALRGANLNNLHFVLSDVATEPDSPAAGLWNALDRLQRIAHAMRDHPEALAIVMQHRADGVAFICISGSASRSIRILKAGTRFNSAVSKLANALKQDLAMISLIGEVPPCGEVLETARAAYQALPSELRRLIESAGTLLLVPDFHVGGSDTPFEILHDGKDFLGTGHIVARFTSLRSLTRAVEHSSRRSEHKRALVLAVPRAPPRDDLQHAGPETKQLRSTLVRRKWEVPDLADSHITPEVIAQYLPYAALFHIAAHGEVGVDEGIVLPDDARFTTNDLLRTRFPQLPFAYINTCSLGSSQYVGAGMSRGIAHGFVQAGAPAAIANLLPVEDVVSAKLASEFYKLAAKAPVGEALRLARRSVSENHPLLWGTTILIGDPYLTLGPNRHERSATDQLLDEFFSITPNEEDRSGARWRAAVTSMYEPENVRIHAAIQLLRAAAEVKGLSTDREQQQWEEVIRMADELDHLSASALARYALIMASSNADETGQARVTEAMPWIEAMAFIDSNWKRVLHDIYATGSSLRFERHGPGNGVNSKTTGKTRSLEAP